MKLSMSLLLALCFSCAHQEEPKGITKAELDSIQLDDVTVETYALADDADFDSIIYKHGVQNRHSRAFDIPEAPSIDRNSGEADIRKDVADLRD